MSTRPALREFFCEYEPCCKLVQVRSELDQRIKYCCKRHLHLAADQRYRDRQRGPARSRFLTTEAT